MRELVRSITPTPISTLHARALRYRDFLTVVLIGDVAASRSPDNWVYIHDPSVKVGRVQNFRSWSPEMIPDEASTCLGLEYFCFEGDGLWSADDDDLIALAKEEIAKIGLMRPEDVADACVVRQPKAYPVYDDAYADNVAHGAPRSGAHFPTLHLVGRNGMHKYNNQDHAMMTGLLTALNIEAGEGALRRVAGQRGRRVWRGRRLRRRRSIEERAAGPEKSGMTIDSKQPGALLGPSRRSMALGDLWNGQLRQFLLYGAISVAALALDYGLLIFLTEYVGIYYLVSASISFLAGMLLVYAASISYIFQERRLDSKSLEFTSFVAIGIAGLLLNAFLLWCLTTATPLSYQLAKLPTAGIVFLFNYLARRHLLFTARSWR